MKLNKKLRYVLIAVPLVLIAGITIGGIYLKDAIYQPVQAASEEVAFTVEEGERAAEIAKRLEDMGLVKNDWVFLGFLKFKKQYSALQAGDYVLNKNYSMIDTIGVLTKGKVVTDKITIPEGWTAEKIGEELEKRGIATRAEFLQALGEKYEFDFLENKPAEADLQGFLFPDTYFLSSRPSAGEVIEKMLMNFQDKVDAIISKDKRPEGLSYYQVLTLASIVEREVRTPEDRRLVAGVFLNRLRTEMPLQSDATLQYILKSDKRIFSEEETKVSSPYNTYQVSGLPPGPIANPGVESVAAVLNPEPSDYFYFLSDAEGKTYFSKTLEEHEEKKALYL